MPQQFAAKRPAEPKRPEDLPEQPALDFTPIPATRRPLPPTKLAPTRPGSCTAPQTAVGGPTCSCKPDMHLQVDSWLMWPYIQAPALR